MSRLVFTVWIPLKPVVSKTSQAEVWLSSYDYLTKCLGQGSASQQLSQRKGAFFLLNKKKALSGLVQVNDRWWREERLTSRKRLWLPAIGTWGYSIRAYKWLGAMSVMIPVCMTPGPHSSISEEFLHSIILRPKKQLESSQYELTPNFRNRKIPRFDRNNPIMLWGQKNLL